MADEKSSKPSKWQKQPQVDLSDPLLFGLSRMTTPMDPVLVLGGDSAVARHIVKKLLDDSHATKVYVFDKQFNHVLQHPKARYLRGDISSPTKVRAMIREVLPKVIFHTASIHMTDVVAPKLFNDVVITGTDNLITAVSDMADGYPRVLIYTSRWVMIHDNSIEQGYKPDQIDHYAETQAKVELLVRTANKEHDLLTTVLRDGDSTSSAQAGRPKFQISDGTNQVDVCSPAKAADAHILAAKALQRETRQDLESIANDMRVNGLVFAIGNDGRMTHVQGPRLIHQRASIRRADGTLKVVPLAN